jgi:hypothetical protein
LPKSKREQQNAQIENTNNTSKNESQIYPDCHALATKRPEMRDERLASKAKLKGSQIEDRAQEDSIRDITCSDDSIGPKVSRSLWLIEHHPCHLN